ncbi:hypothetical protein KCV07_g863, partial [Aureobasidium melanogenum]
MPVTSFLIRASTNLARATVPIITSLAAVDTSAMHSWIATLIDVLITVGEWIGPFVVFAVESLETIGWSTYESLYQTWLDVGAVYGGTVANAVVSAIITVLTFIALDCLKLIRYAFSRRS